jgi:DnaJ-class molecular chaperone
MDNYPPGAANDPSAPYNQKDPEMQKCDECNGDGKFNDKDSDGNWVEYQCDHCEGTGEIEIDEEDLKAAEGDRAYDAWKDSQLEGD